MDHIRFQKNQNNKLDKEVFTTVRIDDPVRYQVGLRYEILCDEYEPFVAKIIKIKNFYDLGEIPIDVIHDDTGLNTIEEFRELMRSFYGDDPKKWVILTLQKV